MTPRQWIALHLYALDTWWIQHTQEATGLDDDSPWSAISSYIDDVQEHHREAPDEPAPAWLALAIRDIPTMIPI
jgi:hypothetical protein